MNQLTELIDFLRFARDYIAPDITVQRLLVLLHVAAHEGSSQQQLAETMGGISATALSRNLADLSALTSRKSAGPGLIEQRSDPDNLRRKQIYLTEKGHRVLRRWQRFLPD